MQLTQHASVRRAQRSVPLDIVETIYWYGQEDPAPGRVTRLTLNSEAVRLASEDKPALRGKLERYRNAYLVLSRDHRIITVARRNRLFFKPLSYR